MAKKSSISLQVEVIGDGVHLEYTPFNTPLVNAASPASMGSTPLTQGDNEIDLPPGTTSVLLVPPSTSTVAKVLKGDPGDTGVSIAMALPTLLSINPTQQYFIITASAAENLYIECL